MASSSITVQLKPGRDRQARHRHPWIFSGAVARVSGAPAAPVPAEADVVADNGEWLGRGLWNPAADLAVRLYAWHPEVRIDAAWLRALVDRALAVREEGWKERAGDPETTAYRLIYSEADGLSGLIVDRYGEFLSVRVEAAALVPFLPDLLDHLLFRTGAHGAVVRAESDAAEREKLDPAAVSSLGRNAPSAPVTFKENGLKFRADLAGGQKTGFFLDQRDNRRRAAACAAGRSVLSAYCYTGAFEVYAARGGAKEIVALDSSEDALAQARAHHELNGLAVPVDYRKADVPVALRRFRDERRSFDLIILDPPRFVFSRAQAEKGMRAYKDINLLAMKLLRPGGRLATFSCSGLVAPAEFEATVRWATVDAGRTVRILEKTAHPFDHPILATCPEGEYLKGLFLRVD